MSDSFDIEAELIEAASRFGKQDYAEAQSACERILAHAPNELNALNLLALIARATKKWGRAEEVTRIALDVHPDSAILYNTLGLITLDQRRIEEAEAAFENAVQRNPDRHDYLINLARIRIELGRLDEALSLLTKVIEESPVQRDAYLLRALVMTDVGDVTTARAELSTAESLHAAPSDVAFGRARCALIEGDLEAAYRFFDSAVESAPDVADAQVNRGTIRLLQGRINEGWGDYSMRHKRRWGRPVARPFPYPIWRGEPLTGKTFLAWAEQGLGEAILCSTLLTDVADEAQSISLECDERLETLFRRTFPEVQVVSRKTQPDPCLATPTPAYQSSLLDMIVHRAPDVVRAEPRPASLKADSAHTEALRSQYKTQSGGVPLVGLSWGSPKALSGRLKVVNPEYWRSLLSVPGVAFVNLQYGDDEQALEDSVRACGATLISDPSVDHSGSLDSVAAQIAALDLVITVSNTTAHLSGALGQKTWVVVPPLGPAAMWYWFSEREDSPWYPNARLKRRRYGKGADKRLLEKIADDLKAWVRTCG